MKKKIGTSEKNDSKTRLALESQNISINKYFYL